MVSGEVAQWLSTLTVLGKDPCSIPSTHIEAITICNSGCRRLDILSYPLRVVSTHVYGAQTYKQAKHLYTSNKVIMY